MGWKIVDTTGEASSWLNKVYATKEEAEEEIRQLEADDEYRGGGVVAVHAPEEEEAVNP